METMAMEASYNWFLVGLSVFVSVFGSFTALQLMRGIRTGLIIFTLTQLSIKTIFKNAATDFTKVS